MDVYTDWCGWCKYMDKTTFANPQIAKYINTNYYPVKFNAEGADTVVYKGIQYTNERLGKIDEYGNTIKKANHSFTYKVLKVGSYPTLVFFDDSLNLITPLPGYQSEFDIQPVIIYFYENLYKYINLQDFINDFKTTYIDSLKPKSHGIEWLNINDAVKKMNNNPKNMLIFFTSDWCATCNIMTEVTFNNPTIADYINKNYYPVKFNATSTDTVFYFEHTFTNPQREHPFHQFAVELLNRNMRFPNFIFMAPDKTLITAVPSYFNDTGLEPVLHYFGEGFYKKEDWDAYRSKFISLMPKQ